jgi:hypothetical protein
MTHGIQGMGDLDPAMYDRLGPVAMVKVVRIDQGSLI